MPYVRPLASYGYLGTVLVFIYLPILIMMAMGFNQSSSYELPFRFDLVWYAHLSANEVLWRAGRNSVLLALASSAVSSVIGTMAALAFARYRLRGQAVLQLLLFPPMAMPWLILATAMLIFFYYSGIGRGLFDRPGAVGESRRADLREIERALEVESVRHRRPQGPAQHRTARRR